MLACILPYLHGSLQAINDLYLQYYNSSAMAEKTIHEGRNVKRLREIFGIKKDTLALELGLSQKAISSLEPKEAIDKDMLEKIAKVLKVPVEAIKNFNEESTISIIANTFNSHDHSLSTNNNCTFNP